jgi:hypothetical protein
MRAWFAFGALALVGCVGQDGESIASTGAAVSVAMDVWTSARAMAPNCDPTRIGYNRIPHDEVEAACDPGEERILGCFYAYDPVYGFAAGDHREQYDGQIYADARYSGDDATKILTHELMHWLAFCNGRDPTHKDKAVWSTGGMLEQLRAKLNVHSTLPVAENY